jgi:hypothetical protein
LTKVEHNGSKFARVTLGSHEELQNAAFQDSSCTVEYFLKNSWRADSPGISVQLINSSRLTEPTSTAGIAVKDPSLLQRLMTLKCSSLGRAQNLATSWIVSLGILYIDACARKSRRFTKKLGISYFLANVHTHADASWKVKIDAKTEGT